MEGRELGCKTLGCGAGALIVLLVFYGMMATTQQAAKQIKLRRGAKNGQTAAQNLQVVARAVAAYETANKRLPPTDSPRVLREALVPTYLPDKSRLIDGATGQPFAPNPQISGKKSNAVPKAYLLTSSADIAGYRTVLFVSGRVRTVGSGEWQMLTAPRSSLPAPAVPSTPVPSPAQSPR
ncbi:MAG: hypothetical protein H7Y38_20540 [Armatimonadetes bacterium]|nr:hypothetical protein [Armatimonadota bacterium]